MTVDDKMTRWLMNDRPVLLSESAPHEHYKRNLIMSPHRLLIIPRPHGSTERVGGNATSTSDVGVMWLSVVFSNGPVWVGTFHLKTGTPTSQNGLPFYNPRRGIKTRKQVVLIYGGCLRAGCWGKYLDLRGRKWRDYIVRSFIRFTFPQILSGW